MNPKSCKVGVCPCKEKLRFGWGAETFGDCDCVFDDKELPAGSIADNKPPNGQLFKWAERSDSGLVSIASEEGVIESR